MLASRLLFFVIFIFILVPLVQAYSTQQYNKIYLNPFYLNSMTANVWYNFSVDVNPPDRIKEVKSAIIFFDTYMSPTRNFTIMVNDKYCNRPSSFYISTTYSSASQARIYFDCSNVITKQGNYTVSLRVAGGNVGSTIGWLDLTYMNNPMSMVTAGTEYKAGDDGRIFVRLLFSNSIPVNHASCNTTVYYPNNTKFIDNQPMTFLERGIYYHDFKVPNITGNYITSFDCTYPSNIFNYTVSLPDIIKKDENFVAYIPFDNSENMTINNAYILYKADDSISDLYFNGQLIGRNLVKNIWHNISLYQNNFTISDFQVLLIDPIDRDNKNPKVILYVNYTNNNPFQMIRGQNEIHVSNNSEILNAIYSVNDTIIETNQNISYMIENMNLTLANLTFNDTNIIQSIYSVNETVNLMNDSISYQISQLPYQIWNFMNRTLTEFNFIVEISSNSIFQILNPIFLRFNQTDEKIESINYSVYQLNQSVLNELYNNYYMLQNINATIYENDEKLIQKIEILNETLNYIFDNTNSINETIYKINETMIQEIEKAYSLSIEINNTLPFLKLNISDIWEYPIRNLTYYPEYDDAELKQMILSLSQNISNRFDEINNNLLFMNNTILSKIDDGNDALSQKINQTIMEIQSLKEDIKFLNDTVIFRLNNLNSSLYSIKDEVIQAIIDNAIKAKDIWEYSYRNLTYYPEFNYTRMSEEVWNYENRSLTLYQNITSELETIMNSLLQLNNTVISSYINLTQNITDAYNLVNNVYNSVINLNDTLYLVNSSIIEEILNMNVSGFNYSEISSYIWNYENRSLTEFNFSICPECIYAINESLSDMISLNFNNTNNAIYALDNNLANNFSYTFYKLDNLNSSIEYYISNSTNNLSAYIQNITIITAEDLWTYEIRTLTTAVNVTAGNISTVENAFATFTDVRYAGATEYASGETSRISYLFVNTQSGNPEPIENGNCFLDVYYPNGTKLTNNQSMIHLEGGLYYHEMTAPNITGIYSSRVYCTNHTYSGIGASTFHVAPWANAIFLLETNSSIQYSNLLSYLMFKDVEMFSEKTCIDNKTLGVKYSYNISMNGMNYPINRIDKIQCSIGCSDGKCIPKSELNLLVFSIISAFGLFLALRKEIVFSLIGSLTLILCSVFLLTSGIEIASLDLLGTSHSYIINNNISFTIALIYLGIAIFRISTMVFKRGD